MRAAIVHYWLLKMRGGEKVLESLCRILPDADIFTLFYEPEHISELIRSHRVTPSFLNPLRKHYRSLLPLMPMALEHFDLRGYDMVVSCESGPAKGVITSSHTHHICYCLTPMRYLWELYPAYLHDWTTAKWKRALMAPMTNYLRLWDVATAARVDEFVADCENVRRRVWKTYRRESQVIYPPVSIESFCWKPSEGYYLMVSELVAYKQLDYAVSSLARSGRKLKVVGEGPEYRRLKGLASGDVEFCGRASDADVRELYSRCRAFVMPGEEDFGITPVEALASGKPVIALGRGGVLETVPAVDPLGGFLYAEPSEAALLAAIDRFEGSESEILPGQLRAWASRFSESVFIEKMTKVIAESATRR
jgi:glycosyltransferase involved in cell wall biosynthesis